MAKNMRYVKQANSFNKTKQKVIIGIHHFILRNLLSVKLMRNKSSANCNWQWGYALGHFKSPRAHKHRQFCICFENVSETWFPSSLHAYRKE